MISRLELNILAHISSNLGEDRANAHAILGMTGVNANPFHVAHKLRRAMVKPTEERYNPDDLDEIDDTVPAIPRAYLQEQLKEPDGDIWPPCANGTSCEGLKLSNVPRTERFIVRAFFQMKEIRVVNGMSRPTDGARTTIAGRVCLLCNRVRTLTSFVSIRENHEGLAPIISIADHCVITDIPGEYTMESTICSKPNAYEGILKPVLLHERHMYKMEIQNGYKYYKELYKYPPMSMREVPPNRDCENSTRSYAQEGTEPQREGDPRYETEDAVSSAAECDGNMYDAGEEILHQAF